MRFLRLIQFGFTVPRMGLPEVVMCSYDPLNPLHFHSSSDDQGEQSSSSHQSQSERNISSSDLKLERWMKVEQKNRAIKVDPVDVSKLGSPRNRRPIVEGNIKRVSDLNFEDCQKETEKQDTVSSDLHLSGRTASNSQQDL